MTTEPLPLSAHDHTQARSSAWPAARVKVLMADGPRRDSLIAALVAVGLTASADAIVDVDELIDHEAVALDVGDTPQRGARLARRLRDLGGPPALLIGRQFSTDAVVAGLEAGCEDAVDEAVPVQEIAARIGVLARRRVDYLKRTAVRAGWRFGGWTYTPRDGRLIAPGGQAVHLSRDQSRLLQCFLERPQQVLTLRDLALAMAIPEASDWRVRISRLRQIFREADPASMPLQTIRGRGYLLAAPIDGRV